jgi:uncharacterized protein (DUF488 family)
MQKNKKEIYTVGHSNHDLDYFMDLIKKYNIDTLIDVRSIAASKYNPQYNKDGLSYSLKKDNIEYLHFDKEFGARHNDEVFLDNDGIVNFESFRKSNQFQSGVERVDIAIEKGHKIALMCSEGDPLDCHRFSMVSVYLEEMGISVKYIMKDGSLRTHQDIERDLLFKFDKKLPKPDLFNQDIDEKIQLKVAYQLHNKKIGWKSETREIEDIYND